MIILFTITGIYLIILLIELMRYVLNIERGTSLDKILQKRLKRNGKFYSDPDSLVVDGFFAVLWIHQGQEFRTIIGTPAYFCIKIICWRNR
jgi:hypothetical protein